VTSPDYTEAIENIRNAGHALRAFMRFSDEVADIAIGMAERGDPAAVLVLRAMKDLQAQTGELYVSEENG
jgi:hypothetical protein